MNDKGGMRGRCPLVSTLLHCCLFLHFSPMRHWSRGNYIGMIQTVVESGIQAELSSWHKEYWSHHSVRYPTWYEMSNSSWSAFDCKHCMMFMLGVATTNIEFVAISPGRMHYTIVKKLFLVVKCDFLWWASAKILKQFLYVVDMYFPC